jgi:rRNA processing protein Gar1
MLTHTQSEKKEYMEELMGRLDKPYIRVETKDKVPQVLD